MTETGRQPWIVYGQLRTADAIAPVAAGAVASSFALFVVIYTVLLGAFFYYATRLVLAGPETRAGPLAVRAGRDSAPAQGRAR